MADFSAFPHVSAAPKKLLALWDGRGSPRIMLSWKEVHAGGSAGLDQLSAFVEANTLGYGHDPFKDEWCITRPTTANLFEGAAHG